MDSITSNQVSNVKGSNRKVFSTPGDKMGDEGG